MEDRLIEILEESVKRNRETSNKQIASKNIKKK